MIVSAMVWSANEALRCQMLGFRKEKTADTYTQIPGNQHRFAIKKSLKQEKEM
jgi:hypothetical protein